MAFSVITLPPSRPLLTNTDTSPTTNAQLQEQLGRTVDALQALDENAQTLRVAIQGAFKNLKLSATGASGLVSITADQLVLKDAGDKFLLVPVGVSASVAASGAGGLDTGVIATGSWYSVWIISNGSVVSSLLSLSGTAPTMPAGYTFKARVGWIRTDGSGNKYPLGFVQYGRRVQYVVAAGSNVPAIPIMASGISGSTVTPTWVAVAVGAYVPASASTITVLGRTQNSNVIAAPNGSYGSVVSTTNPPPAQFGASSGTCGFSIDITLETSNVYWASDSASGVLACLGWDDNI